ncbi:hypothetical protein QBC35DRAFT_396683 [Podospora australis]|uniref:Adenylyl-sulfate kinase n=1 Tax=Podospora australis TaxID=1536484 RepID=A0AAN6WKK8_9PEZI|nr:hypothetical protein QBC35DRAFT_396683 [Podospora australis]
MSALKREVAPIIWMNGFPGTGKLTVAEKLAALCGPENATVLDNHKLIDPVEAKIPRSHPDYQKERQLYRQAVFEEHVCNAGTLSRLVIFTDFQSANELGSQVAKEYQDAASRAGRPFIPIYLICDPEENLKRVANSDRVNSRLGKLTDRGLLQKFMSRCDLFRFDVPDYLTVDTTTATPWETATEILVFLKLKKAVLGGKE